MPPGLQLKERHYLSYCFCLAADLPVHLWLFHVNMTLPTLITLSCLSELITTFMYLLSLIYDVRISEAK